MNVPETRMQFSAIAARLLREAAIFFLERGPAFYRVWPGEKLFKFLAFQWLAGCLILARDGRDIRGALIWWPDDSSRILEREMAGDYHFAWQLPAEAGDAILLGDVIATDNNSLSRLVQMASERRPDWKMRRIFTHRRGRLVELKPRAIERFLHGIRPVHS